MVRGAQGLPYSTDGCGFGWLARSQYPPSQGGSGTAVPRAERPYRAGSEGNTGQTPGGASPKLPALTAELESIKFEADEVRKMILGFPTGSAAGASATRPQLLKDIIGCPNKAVGEAALLATKNLVNHMAAGRAPREFAPFIAGAPLMALNKSSGGLRPIAIGETIRRLVSKCCCKAVAEDCKIIFGPLQIGVATRGGAEASIHAVRKLSSEFESDPGKILLKVDFSNAFNVVDRTEMLVQVLEKLPKIYRWVEYCYSSRHTYSSATYFWKAPPGCSRVIP